MKLELGQLGSAGVVWDIKPFDLPPNIFNKSMNVDFTGTVAKPMVAAEVVLRPLPETREPVKTLQGWVSGNIAVWVAICFDSVWLLYQDEWRNITPVDFQDGVNWQLFNFNGYIVFNNGRSVPFYVDLFDFLVPAKPLPNWPVGVTTSFLGSLNGFLIGFGLTSSGGYFDRQVVFWSDVAEQGQLPSNYRFDDPTSRAGFVPLPDEEGIVTGLELRNSYIFYRSKSIWELRFVGGNSIFAFERRDKNTTLLNPNCVVEVDNMHFFIGLDSFYFYDGFTKTVVGKGQVTDTFFANVNKDSVYVVADVNTLTIWIFYSNTSTAADTALLFRYKQGFFFPREINNAQAYGSGLLFLPEETIAWQDLSTDWTNWEATWEINYEDNNYNRLVWVAGESYYTVPVEGSYMAAYLERNFMAFAETDQAGTLTVNRTLRKFVREVWPELNEGQVNFSFGMSDTVKDSPVWLSYQPFDTSSQMKQDWAFSTKYISVRINNELPEDLTSYFELTGLALEIMGGGKY